MTQALDTAYTRLRLSDVLVAKAAKLSEVAQIARLEGRLRDYLAAKWGARASAAARAGAKHTSPAAIKKAVDAEMAKWEGEVSAVFKRDAELIYRLAHTAGAKKATGQYKGSLQYDGDAMSVLKAKKPSVAADFTLEDEGAIAALNKRNMFWTGAHYGENVGNVVAKVARETIIAGKTRAEAGRVVEGALRAALGTVETPSGWRGTSAAYFEGVTANAATVARAYGQLSAFKKLGVATYTIVNPRDERTCPVCGLMDGKTFSVKDGINQVNRELKAKTPEDVKKIHPWMSASDLKKVSAVPGRLTGAAGARDSKALAGRGLALPAYHMKCRCTVDIDESSLSFDDLA